MKTKIFVIMAFVMATFIPNSFAVDTDSLYEMSLDELLNLDVSVASIQARPIREQAGIVTVVTRQEIEQMGARDLQDILMQVPGYHFGADVTGVTGIGTRGFWSYDGKLTVIVDGIEMTETLYGAFPIGGHLFADQIERVEIIRGPGSAMYGGNAETAVINITTVASGLDGGTVNTSIGTSGGEASMRGGVSYGRSLEEGGHYYLSAAWEDGYRSDREYTGMDGASFDLGDDSGMEVGYFSAGVDYNDFEIRLAYDQYYLDDRTFWGFWDPGLSDTYNMDFDTFAASLGYNINAGDRLTISPKITYRLQNPWVMKGGILEAEAPESLYRIETTRLTYDLTAVATVSDSSSIQAGVQYYEDWADSGDNFTDILHFEVESKDIVNYNNLAAFAQYEADTPIANITIGGRYEDHSEVGDSFVPRIGITKAWDRFHTKLLYSQAFRTPQFELINYGQTEKIEPETTTSYELEAGYRLSETISLVANIFHMSIEDILIYEVAFDGEEGYRNWDKVANYGVEAEIRIRDTWGNASVGYSFYRNDKNTVPSLESSKDDMLLGFPQHKLTYNVTYLPTGNLSLNLNGALLGKREGYTDRGLEEFDSSLYTNAFVQYTIGNYRVGVGVNDIFDEGYDYIQPYNGDYAPLPDKSREFFVRATATF